MDTGSGLRAAFSPRLYFLHPLVAGPLPNWSAQFARIAAMGFDHVLLPPIFETSPGGRLSLVANFDRPHAALAAGNDAVSALRGICQSASKAGLRIVLDLVLDRCAAGGVFAQQHRDWLDGNGADALDPRVDPQWRGGVGIRLDDNAVIVDMQQFWSERIARWVDAGVAGFCVQWPQRLPRQLIGALMHEVPGCRFIAGAQGMDWADHEKLIGLDYDAAIGSSAFWDFRSSWFIDEQTSLSRVAPVIAVAEAPFEARVAQRFVRRDLAERAARRIAQLAAHAGCGWLVPMGFEYGAIEPLNPTGGAPSDFARWRETSSFELGKDIVGLNRQIAANAQPTLSLLPLSGPASNFTAVLRAGDADARRIDEGVVLIANPDLEHPVEVAPASLLGANAGGLTQLRDAQGEELALDHPLQLQAGELLSLRAERPAPVLANALTRTKRSLDSAVKLPRVAIEAITPAIDGGEFVVKRIVGQSVQVECDAFMDGHDQVAVALLWRAADESQWKQMRMRPIGNDRWAGEFPLERLGRYQFTIEAWRDAWASYRHEIEKKHAAKLKISLELTEGLSMVCAASTRASDAKAATLLRELCGALSDADDETRFKALIADDTAEAMKLADERAFAARHEPYLIVDAERPAAEFASWYELFPRSMSGDPNRHGTFLDVIPQLPRIREMGFDVLYLPPIHPIGRKHRKGRNNSLTAGPDDPGSPYAIGAAEGGYEAVDPRLGTLEDFRRMRDAASEHGMEIALDFAIQCSPDHPWLKDHPDWFAWRPDGTIKYAENPPKKYEDIVNVDFYAQGAMPALWVALRDAVLFWCNEGVRCFRVDNPHTKPLPFWKWMIADVRGRHPDAVFLAEAFTRPKLMKRLAKIGYSQSYTYFTWRNNKHELIEYITELTQTEMRDYFRPHFFVNTPDINPVFLQTSGRPGHLIRAALAATLSGLWGVYSGFELCEATPLPGREEYLDSEKYQLRVWDWDRPGNITAEIAQLNYLRRRHPALQSHLGVEFLNCWNDQLMIYRKSTPDRSNVVLVAVSLDPHRAQEADFELPLWEFGQPDHGSLLVSDLLHGGRAFHWSGKIQHLRLTPDRPYAIWQLSAPAQH